MPILDRPLNHPLERWTKNFALAIGVSCALSIVASAGPKDTTKNAPKDVPVYKVDPFWPKPLPHHWLMQGVPVMVVDKDDHIWVMNRPRDVNPDEIYIVDAKRVLVYDYEGKFKRGWGGHGIPLSEIDNDPTPPYDWKSGPPPDQKQFAPALHCVHFSTDGLVYVCERGSNRIQVFTKEGKFVSSFFVHPSTPSRGPECGGPGSTMFGMCGTTYNLTFSHDAGEKYVMIADGTNDKVWIHDRKTGELAGSIGDNGRMAGYFHWIDAIAIDSHGNLYTGEVDTGKRAQKFVLLNGDKTTRSRPHE